ncbi:hypothetical protein Trydic_g1034 [Trypoxylus dichotomus]
MMETSKSSSLGPDGSSKNEVEGQVSIPIQNNDGTSLNDSNSSADGLSKCFENGFGGDMILENSVEIDDSRVPKTPSRSDLKGSSNNTNELVLSIGNIEVEEIDTLKHLYTQRSISTPDSLVPRIVPDLLERPKTVGSNADKLATDSPKSRIRRKESFLQTVANVFKKKIETSNPSESKPTTIHVQKPSPFPSGCDSFLQDVLYKFKEGDFKMRWCLLRTDFFMCYLDSDLKIVEECLSMESVVSAQILDDPKFDIKIDDSKLYCFELRTAIDRYIFGTKNENQRTVWMQKIAESLNCKLAKEVSDYQRIGWLYTREGLNGTWFGAWLLLSNRTLFYTTNNDVMHSIDLRKARCIILQETTDTDCLPQVLEQGPCLVIDVQRATFYHQSWNLTETECWYSSIKKANRNGSYLEEQQLYSYDVPVIVEKCINFIYLHGSMLTGIYRRTGQKTKSEQIVVHFKQDAWSIQLPPDTYSGYDVATAFKMFFSQLTEPIIALESQEKLRQVFFFVGDSDEVERIRQYQQIFQKYPTINYNTLRMLLRHLHFIVEYEEKNLMTSENLANVWGVTMLRSNMDKLSSSNTEYLNKDLELIADLINLSSKIFPESEKERHHEMLVRKTWEQHFTIKRPDNKVFRIWIYYDNKEGECYNVEVGLHKTAKDICEELSVKIDLPSNKLILEESILNGQLTRPIHYDEKVLDIVMRWTNWEEVDKKDNYLIISNLDKYEPYLMDSMLPAMMELKFADRKAKNFHVLTFELSCSQLTAYRDINKTQEVKSWNIQDIEWYIGNERHRNPPAKHTITFIEKLAKQNRTDTAPWFGNVLSFSSEFTKITWISSLWKEQHKKEFLPLAMEYLIKRCQDNLK